MRTPVEPRLRNLPEQAHGTRAVAYSALAAAAAMTSVAIWLLLIVDEDRSIGAATLEMAVKFTNVTVVLIAVVAAWIAFGTPGPLRRVAHVTVMVMAVVTALVNATLLDAALPSGWWGVVDLFQHYLIPAAVVAAWALLGPSVAMPNPELVRILVVPLVWLIVVLSRGAVTESYPYDFIDVAANGWLGVLPMVLGVLLLMVVLGAGLAAIDRHRIGRGA